uniref:phospho-sugar mutase n=1 Tax=Agathobacter sp. TaxID=2021311 RepID=UPI00405669AB
MKLKFGTGGLRAVMGDGDGCMNISAIQRATLGVAAYIKKEINNPCIAIAYDTRNHSRDFAKETARILASEGCLVSIYPTAMPTPLLSFAVRELKCHLGVCITASHNPKEYNGYKVYGSDGCQITSTTAKAIQNEIDKSDETNIRERKSFEDFVNERTILYISDQIKEAYLEAILKYRTCSEAIKNIRIVYTPLHGTGLVPMLEMFKAIGVQETVLVKEQINPDGNFPACPCPNPEEDDALKVGVVLCQKRNADILLATDPDSDRIGVVAKHGHKYERLNGNQLGILILDYLLCYKKNTDSLPEKPVILKTIVTTSMVEKIAAEYGAEVIDTLTGFKYIGEQLAELEKSGTIERFVLGLEESCGYLIGPYVRDKDAIGTAMIVCEMAENYKKQGKTLWNRLEELYKRYGYYYSTLETKIYEESEAKMEMEQLRTLLKTENVVRYDESIVVQYEDYLEGLRGLPKANVVKLWLEDGRVVVIRPSGTEPKIKVYIEKCMAM